MRDFKTPGKYRRAFDWRISHSTPDSLPTDMTGMVRLSTSDYPEILEDFLYVSRKRKNNWTALSRLQLHMIEELLVQEDAVKRFKERLNQLEGEWKPTNHAEKPPQEIALLRAQLHFHRLYASAVRAIGDGIAWRSLGYDRAVTRTLSEHQTKQTLASEGLLQELREWSSHFERGTGLAIFNALTNSLAIGDVTVVRDDESVEIIEVKSSNTKSGRTVRQRQKMTEVVSRLRTGEGQSGDKDVEIEILPVVPETGLDRVEELLNIAESKAWAARKISNCLYVEAFDFRKIVEVADLDALKRDVDAARNTVVGEWERRGDFVTDANTLDMLAFSPNCAPFSIFPFTPRTCVDLLIGAKYYMAYLNHTAVGREFEVRGWTVEKNIPLEHPVNESDKEKLLLELQESFMRVSKGRLHINIPPADFTRLHLEALRAKSLIDLYESKFKQSPQEGQYVLSLFEGESQIWD